MWCGGAGSDAQENERQEAATSPAEATPQRALADQHLDGRMCQLRAQAYTDVRYSSHNQHSVGALFAAFFARLAAVEELWCLGLSVCPFTGKWAKGSQFATGKYCMTVEDPFAFHENCARSVQSVRVCSCVCSTRCPASSLALVEMNTARSHLETLPY